jgi:hypothetical protein
MGNALKDMVAKCPVSFLPTSRGLIASSTPVSGEYLAIHLRPPASKLNVHDTKKFTRRVE